MRIFLVVIIAMAYLAGCSTESSKRSSQTGAIAQVDSLIQQEVDQDNLAGAVIRVQHEDSILHYNAYGFAQKYTYGMNLMEEPEKMTRGHLFDLASLTKVFATTYGIMLLVDSGELALDDPISNYLPAFADERGDKNTISIRHLLTHTSGLPQWYPLYYKASNKYERRDVIANMPLKWPVGSERHYSDLGFMLLGDIIEQVSGRNLNQYLDEQLYRRLNLKNTIFNPNRNIFTDIAATSHGNPFEKRMVYDDDFGYRIDVDPASWDGWREYTLIGEVNDGNAWYANSGVAGHAGLFSTADDLQVLVNLLLDKGAYRGEQIISESVIDTFLTKNNFENALGWVMQKEIIAAEGTPEGTFGHTGFTGTNVVIIPKFDLSIILLTNRQHVGPGEDGTYLNLRPLRQKIVDLIIHDHQTDF
jgi:CubicO group peptidase (beta-lactamase class C family)